MATKAIVRYRTRAVKKHSRRAKLTLPLGILAGFAPALVSGYNGARSGGLAGFATMTTFSLTGYNMSDRSWSFPAMIQGLAPIAAGMAVHKLAGMLGINAALGRARVPLFRI
jgi:hypothetical protein